MSDGPFTDDDIRYLINVNKTQRAIIEYAEGIAKVLAEAGRASQKAVGDRPEVAVDKWMAVIRKRVMEILKEDEIANARGSGEGRDKQISKGDKSVELQTVQRRIR